MIDEPAIKSAADAAIDALRSGESLMESVSQAVIYGQKEQVVGLVVIVTDPAVAERLADLLLWMEQNDVQA